MLLRENMPLDSPKLIDYGVDEYDPFKGRSFGPQYTGAEAFALSAMNAYSDGPLVNLVRWGQREVNTWLDKRRGEKILTPEELKESYGFNLKKGVSKRVADQMFADNKRIKYYEDSLGKYVSQGGSRTLPILGMLAGVTPDIVPLVIGANVSAMGFASSKILKSYMGTKNASLLGGVTFDTLEGFMGNYFYQQEHIRQGRRDTYSKEENLVIGTGAGLLGGVFGYNVGNRLNRGSVNLGDFVEKSLHKNDKLRIVASQKLDKSITNVRNFKKTNKLVAEMDVKVPAKIETAFSSVFEEVIDKFDPINSVKFINWDYHLGKKRGSDDFVSGENSLMINGKIYNFKLDEKKFNEGYKRTYEAFGKPYKGKGILANYDTEKADLIVKLGRFADTLKAKNRPYVDEVEFFDVLEEGGYTVEEMLDEFYSWDDVPRGVYFTMSRHPKLHRSFLWTTKNDQHNTTRTFLHELTHWINDSLDVTTNFPVREKLLGNADDELITDLSVMMFLDEKGFKTVGDATPNYMRHNLRKKMEEVYSSAFTDNLFRSKDRAKVREFAHTFLQEIMEQYKPYVQRNLSILNGVYDMNPDVLTNGKIDRKKLVAVLLFSLGIGTLGNDEIEGMEYFLDNKGKL